MQVGDLVYVPYFEEYGIIVSKYHYDDDDVDEPHWNVVFTSGYHSNEYEEDMELIA